MWRIQWSAVGLVFLLMTGCAPRPSNISGAYVARGQSFVELLQLTQSPDGQLLGSLEHYGIQSNGASEQATLNVSGSTDGKSLTLVIKRNEPFAVATNISGAVDSGSITLNQASGEERFIASSAATYQTDVGLLNAKGQATQASLAQTQHVNDENTQVIGLIKSLNTYSAKIEANHNWLPTMHAGQAKILDAVRKDLDIETKLKTGDEQQVAQVGMIQARISELYFQMSSFNIPLDQTVQQGHEHIQQFDQAIASSPCKTNTRPYPIACTGEGPAEQRYQAARAIALQEMDDAAVASKQSMAEVTALNKQAGN